MKRILITGGSSGIGRSVAFYLAEKGFRVVGTTRHPERLPVELSEQQNVRYVAMDVTDPASVRNGISEALEHLGGLDVLVNNAGISHLGPFELISEESARQYVETNFLGVSRVTRAILPVMREQKDGLIINIGSLAGLMGIPFQAYYAATKFALEGFTESIRMELQPFGIRVTIVEPGNFITEIAQHRQTIAEVPPDYSPHYGPARSKIEESLYEGDDPRGIAELIGKIIQLKKPKVRYAAGKGSKMLSLLAKHLPDFLTERILQSYYGLR